MVETTPTATSNASTTAKPNATATATTTTIPPKTGEAAPPVVVATEDPKLSSKFAALAKEEKRTREERQKLIKDQTAFKEKESKFSKFEQYENKLKTDPVAFLEEHGITYSDFINYGLTKLDKNETIKDPTQLKLQKIEEQLAAEKKEKEERAVAIKQQQEKDNWDNHIKELVGYILEKKDNEYIRKDNYEVILTYPDEGDALYKSLVEKASNKLGRTLTGPEYIAVLDRTEELLTKNYEAASKLKKFAPKIEVATETPIPTTDSKKDTVKQKTLTNKLTSNVNPASVGAKVTKEQYLEQLRAKKRGVV